LSYSQRRFIGKKGIKMRKPLASRIAGLAVIYCLAFFILVILQFSDKGNFSLSVGAMTIRGRYLQDSLLSLTEEEIPEAENGIQAITGGIKLYYGGLEFSLNDERGKGLMLIGTDGDVAVNPDYLILTNNTVRFGLPGGTVIVFSSIDSARGPELQISAEFTENIYEVTIPITPRRSSLVHENGQLGIMYGGLRYLFSSRDQELERGTITLSRGRTFISYRSRGKQAEFNPADFIIAQSQNYDSAISNWRGLSFNQWNRNPALLQNEDDIIAFLSEALARGGNFTAAVAALPRDFVNSARQTHRSAGFTGGMANAYRSFTVNETEKLQLITRLTRERSPDIFREEHILDYLFTRSNTALANEVLDIIHNADPEILMLEHCPGLLEASFDIRRWRPQFNNPVESLADRILLLISDNLKRDTENDHVFVSNSEVNNLEFNLRLGKALINWARTAQNTEWEAIGKSLVLSALTSDGAGAGRLYNILSPSGFYPRAVWLSDNGQWAWTVSSSVRTSTIDGNLNIAVTFPATMTHHIIIRGIRPFIRLQIHGMDWRTDSQFERYDSSGWVYYPQDQVLILKLRHRELVENIRIIYREEPQPVIQETVEPETL